MSLLVEFHQIHWVSFSWISSSHKLKHPVIIFLGNYSRSSVPVARDKQISICTLSSFFGYCFLWDDVIVRCGHLVWVDFSVRWLTNKKGHLIREFFSVRWFDTQNSHLIRFILSCEMTPPPKPPKTVISFGPFFPVRWLCRQSRRLKSKQKTPHCPDEAWGARKDSVGFVTL